MSAEKEVSAQDQKDINAFSKLNARHHELQEDVKDRKDLLVNLEDAQNEVMMQIDDSEPVKFGVGEVWFDLSQDDATALLDGKVDETKAEFEKLESEMFDIKMGQLKGRLTAKFGKNINLDEED